MARKGQKSITIYLPIEKYAEIKKASEDQNLSMKDYILQLHDHFYSKTEDAPIGQKLDLIVERLDRLEKKLLRTPSRAVDQSETFMEEELDEDELLRLEPCFGHTRTEKQRRAIITLYSLLKSRSPRGVALQEARKATNSSARSNLDKMVEWGLAKKEGSRYFFIPQ